MDIRLIRATRWFGEWVCVLALLVINDFILRQAVGISTWYMNFAEWLPYLFVSAAFVLITRPVTLLIKIVIFSTLQLVWFGTYRYFGNALSPELVMLSLSQLYEVGETARGEFRIFFVPLVLVIALNAVFFAVLLQMKRNQRQNFGRTGLALAFLPFIIVSARAFLHGSPAAMTPSPYLPSHTATVQSVMLAVRSLVTTHNLTDLDAPSLTYSASPPEHDEPTTVVMIMGESISPMQMDMYGAEPGSMPRMMRRLSNPGALAYSVKIGFSHGVATLGSVPMTLRLSHNPVVAQRDLTTLPQLAKQQGFSVGIYSAQNILPLQIAGRLNVADAFETIEEWRDQYSEKYDGILLDHMEKSPLEGKNRFYFLHQRTNHSPHECNLPTSQAVKTEIGSTSATLPQPETLNVQDRDRIASYRHGLLCYDKSLDELLGYFEKFSGAVYIFIMADHNELMGEGGRWGHARLELDNAIVPMIMATNRPDSAVAKKFGSFHVPTAFDVARLTAKLFGVDVSLMHPDDQFYVNGILAFGQAGYFALRRTDDPSHYRYRLIRPSIAKSQNEEQEIRIPIISDMLNHLETGIQNKQ